MIWAGMIVGFDHDDPGIFEDQAAFLDRAGIAVAMLGMLNAPPRTPLFERLRREGRIHEGSDWTDNCAWTNIVPKRMSRAELFRGYADLASHLYEQEAYARRVRANVARMEGTGANVGRRPSVDDLGDFFRTLRIYGLSRDRVRRRHFLPNLLRIGREHPTRIVEAAIHLGLWRHFETYVPELAASLDRAIARERGDDPEEALGCSPGSRPGPVLLAGPSGQLVARPGRTRGGCRRRPGRAPSGPGSRERGPPRGPGARGRTAVPRAPSPRGPGSRMPGAGRWAGGR